MDDSAKLTSAKFAAWLARPNTGVAISGASGWLGKALTQFAISAGAAPGSPRLRLFASAPGTVAAGEWKHPLEALENAAPLGAGEWLVLHFAVGGADRNGGDPQRVRAVNDALLRQAMALAERAAQCRFVFASSGAAGRIDEPDLPDPVRAYGQLKLDQEAELRAWAQTKGLRLLVPRIFNMGGPFVTSPRRYALTNMILQLSEKGAIAIQADRPVFRSFVHVFDLAAVLFDAVLDDAGPQLFDVAGSEVVEMGELAAAVAAALGQPAALVTRPAIRDWTPEWYAGDGRLFRTAMMKARRAPTPLRRIILDAAADLTSPQRPGPQD